MAEAKRELDVVVWGATGFTGRLVAEYLLEHYGGSGPLRWALGGRSRSKLEALREDLARDIGGGAAELELVLGDGDDEASLTALAERTRVVCTTVGPYARYGSKLVAACVRTGTHYCDLTGEAQWMRRMIDAHQAEAETSGARLVHTCGFDSIPSDLGVFFLQREMQARHGAPCARIGYRVVGFQGGFSGGTAASMLNVLEEATRDPEVRRVLADPYGLNPAGRRSGPDGPERMSPAWDSDFESWTAPFVMGAINTRVVRRTNALLGDAYGADFRYDEAVLTGSGPVGWLKAAGTAAGMAGVMAAGGVGPLRRLIGSRLPAPGEGPSKAQREAGYWDVLLHGEHPEDRGKSLRARATGDRDPGYGSTAKMLGESAVCLALDPLTAGGGFWTPASAMGEPLLARLQEKAGVRFSIEAG
ncbi:MAG: saccharopine dehydrogenase NADP-binding domain-containing protein [Myxococcota bacterium]|nr:saccharopine dehydrogenase NADP-binding domain-containing protein [Myxococcota bacterium]